MAPKWEFWTLYTYWDAFLVVLGDSLLFKSISNMNIGFIVPKHPLNTFFGPLEASRGLKIGPTWEFWYLYTYWDTFLGGSGWFFDSQVYIHYGHWVHSLKVSLKHLFLSSGGQEDSKLAKIESFELRFQPSTPPGMLFWMILGDSLLPKSILIMNIRFTVKKQP